MTKTEVYTWNLHLMRFFDAQPVLFWTLALITVFLLGSIICGLIITISETRKKHQLETMSVRGFRRAKAAATAKKA